MGLFSRRQPDADNEVAATGAGSPEPAEAPEGTDAESPVATGGPWDLADLPEDDQPGRRIDLGSLRVPGVDGMQLRLEKPRAGGDVSAVVLVLGGSTLELRAFAAPRSTGIWEELRGDIVAELARAKAGPRVAQGEHGAEVVANVPVRSAEGETQKVPVRFLGVDGPRWFLRGVLQGPAALDDPAAQVLREVFNGTVVVRDGQARPPREVLPLHAPGALSGPAAEDLPGLEPLEPGPTVAEVR